MYLGKIVELVDKKELFEHTAHPYFKALFSAIPWLDGKGFKDRIILQSGPLVSTDSHGCRFGPRCLYRLMKYDSEPELLPIAQQHYISYHLFE